MSTGLYLHTTRAPGTLVTARLYNESHKNQLDNDIAESCGAQSDTLTMFRATTDPYPGSVATPVPALGTELQQLRYVISDIKRTLNGGTAPLYWYVPVTPTQATVVARGARVFRNTTQAIPTGFGTLTAIIFNTTRYDTGVVSPAADPFFSGGAPTRLTARIDGLYQINGFGQWDLGTTTGLFGLAIRRNGTQILADSRVAPDGVSAQRFMQVGTQMLLAENDYVELVAFHNMITTPFNIINPDFALELITPTEAVTTPPLQGMLHATQTTLGAFTGTRYISLSTNIQQFTTEPPAAAKIAKTITLRNLRVRLNSAGIANGDVTCRFVVNGTPSSAIVAFAASGGGAYPVVTGTGTLTVPADALLSVEVVKTGAASITILSATARYEV